MLKCNLSSIEELFAEITHLNAQQFEFELDNPKVVKTIIGYSDSLLDVTKELFEDSNNIIDYNDIFGMFKWTKIQLDSRSVVRIEVIFGIDANSMLNVYYDKDKMNYKRRMRKELIFMKG